MLPTEAQENSDVENSDYLFALLWPPKEDTKIYQIEHTGKDENVFLTGIRATYTPVDCGGGQGPLLLRGTGTMVQSHSMSENRPSLFSVEQQEQPQTACPAVPSAVDTPSAFLLVSSLSIC